MDLNIFNAIDEEMERQNFKRKGKGKVKIWYRSMPEVLQFVALEKDYPWSKRYSFSVGVFVKSLEDLGENPKERFAHISAGVYKCIKGEFANKFRYDVMDFGKNFDEDERKSMIIDFLSNSASEFFDKTENNEEILINYKNGYFEDTFFLNKLRDHLRISRLHN